MIVYNRYLNQEDHTWYDSSNVMYSKCYDIPNSPTKNLKIVFKNGRTYMYKDVDAGDYLMFKTAKSNGESFNKFIKKYPAMRIGDTDMEKLSKMQEEFKQEQKDNDEQKLGDLVYSLKVIEKTGEFVIMLGDRVLFRGVEGEFSILNLFASLSIKYRMETVDELPVSEEEKTPIA